MPTIVTAADIHDQFTATTDAGSAVLTHVNDPQIEGGSVWEIETAFAGDRIRLDYTAHTYTEALTRLDVLVATHLTRLANADGEDVASRGKRPVHRYLNDAKKG